MYVELDENQKQAIETISGPSMIVAGPGSGKTFVIVEKVNMLVESGVPPDSILCLTFTEKAAGEMKQRLEKHGVVDSRVSTFHGFAKEILEDNFIESGLGRSTRIFKETSQLVWCIRNTDRFDFDTEHLDLGNNQIRIYTEMLDTIRSCKEEMITPQEISELIKSNLDRLEEEGHDDANIQKQLKYYYRLGEFNKVYSAYEDYLKEKNLIDFDDMISKAIELLQRDKAVLQNCLDRFRYILVDEFQDNNYSQWQLVKLLGQSSNVTAVGDDNQCIMRFQGAYSGIFEDFEQTYRNYKKIELGRNYRSTKNIVSLANQLLEHVDNREQRSYSEEEEGDPVSVIRTPTDKGEVEFIVKTIRSLIGTPIKRRDGSAEPLTYRDIAILSRRKIDGHKFTRSLRSFGIPATFVGEANIFTSTAILDLFSLLKVADSPSTSGPEIYRLLKSHGISDQNIAVLTNAAHKKARHVYEGQEDFVLEAVRDYKSFRITQKAEIREVVGQIDKVLQLGAHATISEMVYKTMFDISGIYKRSANSEKEQDKKSILLLNRFYEIAQEFQDIYPTSPLSEFLAHIEVIGEFEIEIEDVASDDTVNVLTMHKSKGKQFPVVFVTDLAEGRFPGKWRDLQFPVPAELRKSSDAEFNNSEEAHIDDERRLLYVAMSRAMNRLFLLYPKRYSENVNEKRPSRFLHELDYENNPKIKLVDFDESASFNMEAVDVIERKKAGLQEEAARAISQMHLSTAVHRIVELARIRHYERHASLDGFVPEDVLRIDMDDLDLSSDLAGAKQSLINREEFTLSPSSIRAFGDCPLKFKYQKIMRVPQPASVATDLGKVIHAVAEEMAGKKSEDKEITLERAMKKLKERWIFRSYQNQADEDNALGRAEQMVRAYVRWDGESKNRLVGVEIPFEVKIGEITFAGRIDRLEQNPEGGYEVIDFKSGSGVKSGNKAMADPQLNIYAKAVEKIKGELPAKAFLFYLEKDRMVQYPVTRKSVNEALGPITEMTENILKEDFRPTPSYQACKFCAYQSICDAKVDTSS